MKGGYLYFHVEKNSFEVVWNYILLNGKDLLISEGSHLKKSKSIALVGIGCLALYSYGEGRTKQIELHSIDDIFVDWRDYFEEVPNGFQEVIDFIEGCPIMGFVK